MKRFPYILIMITLLLGRAGVGLSQDYARMGERTIMGTARYVGMGGAMTAIGGDPSAAHDNPAGLGLYRRAEVLLTADMTLDRTCAKGTAYTAWLNKAYVPQASVVLSFPSYALSDEDIQFNNVLFSYRRLRAYSREIYASTQNAQPSLGSLLASTDVEWDIPFPADPNNASSALRLTESGAVNEFALDWAMNISNRWFVGAGVQALSYSLSASADYSETFNMKNVSGSDMSNRNRTTLLLSGTGVTASLGLIYRPTGWMRLGFGLQTASIGALRTYTTGYLTAYTDSLRASYAPDLSYSNSGFHMPWHISTSAAFQIGAYAMAALQYDYWHQKGEAGTHSLRAGFEVIPVLGMYINAGYAYESTFRRDMRIVPMDVTFERQDTYFQHPLGAHYASVALGYRGTYVLVQAAYQYCLQSLNLWSHEAAEPFDVTAQTHRIVLTLGWHRN